MRRKIFIVIVLFIAAAIAFLASLWLPLTSTQKLFESVLTIAVVYALFSVIVEELLVARFKDTRTRYSFRKATSISMAVVAVVVLLRIWIPDPQALLVAYGVVGAGIAVALQDLFKNVAGSIAIFFGGLYEVGNRIEINGTYGDVIDIGLMNTTMLEIREWIGADQATGRITTIPNGAVLSKPLQNYTKHHKYLWDEIVIVVTPESDWQRALTLMEQVGHEHTREFVEQADKSLTRLERYYYVEGHILDPNAYIQPHANGYELTLRYVVDAWKRRSTNSDIWSGILQAFEADPGIEIAPTTYAVAEYPEAKR